MKWFRLYAELIDDPKVGILSDAEFRTFIELMCLACREESGGITGVTVDEASWVLRRDVTETVTALQETRLVTVEQSGKLAITNWGKRQKKADSSKDRVRKYRENQKKKTTEQNVTLQKPDGDASEESREEKSKKDSLRSSSNTTESASFESPFTTIPLNNGDEYPISHDQVREFARLYPNIDVAQTLNAIRGWNIANPTKRKTRRGILNHINSWLAKEQDRGPRRGSNAAHTRDSRLSAVERVNRANFGSQSDEEGVVIDGTFTSASGNNAAGMATHGRAVRQ